MLKAMQKITLLHGKRLDFLITNNTKIPEICYVVILYRSEK